jgi:hypothetical protein
MKSVFYMIVILGAFTLFSVLSYAKNAENAGPLILERALREKNYIGSSGVCRMLRSRPAMTDKTFPSPTNPKEEPVFDRIKIISHQPEIVGVLSDLNLQVQLPDESFKKIRLRAGDRFRSSGDISVFGLEASCFAEVKGHHYIGSCPWLSNLNPRGRQGEYSIISDSGPEEVWLHVRSNDNTPLGWCLMDWEIGG